MAIGLPGRHPAYEPIGRLRGNPFHKGKRSLMMPLNLTAMVDMFTVIVIFLLQSFSASGELMFIQKDIELPKALQSQPLNERGPVVTLFQNEVLIEGERISSLDEIDDNEPGITPLSERLKSIREREEEMFGRDHSQAYEGHFILQADSTTDFKLVRKVIYSVNEAGWTHLQFTVLGEGTEGGEGGEGGAHGGAHGGGR